MIAATLLLCMLAHSAANSHAQNTHNESAAKPDTAEQSTEAILWLGNMTEARKAHESAVIRLALEKSRDRYGPYQLSINTTQYSHPRAVRNLRDGVVAQVATAPELTYRLDTQEQPLITIPIPLLNGLLGSRKIIIRRDRVEDFAAVHTLEQLQQFNAGLGFDWLDRDYFNQAGLPFTRGADISQLLNMLVHGRFDYLPLGSMEAAPTLAASEHSEQLMILDELIIHYPFPVYVQVSRNHPTLAARLKLGLERAQEDGSLAQLFDQHYGAFETAVKPSRIIELQHNQQRAVNETQTLP